MIRALVAIFRATLAAIDDEDRALADDLAAKLEGVAPPLNRQAQTLVTDTASTQATVGIRTLTAIDLALLPQK